MRTHLGTAALVLAIACAGCNGGGGGSGGGAGGVGDGGGGSAPGAPSGLSARRGVQKVELTWQAVDGATSYDVYWATASGVTTGSGTRISGLTATSFAHTGLLPGTYFYVVTALNAAGASAPSAEVSAPVHPVAFASSTTGEDHGAILGDWEGAGGKTGLEAGDTICQSLAAGAGLVGTFRAWLSDDTSDAYCRIHDLTGKRSARCGQAVLPATAGPWLRADGAPWAARIDEITRASGLQEVRIPLRVDEHGTAIDPAARTLATGTGSEGDQTGHCSGWTVANTDLLITGSATGIGADWGSSVGTSCNAPGLRLLCMQLGAGPDLPAPVSAGARKAFVTSASGTGRLQSWTAAGGKVGLTAGHAICQTLAGAAGLANPTRYKAWLGVKDPGGVITGPSPSDVLASDGPWERLDGILLARTRAELAEPVILSGLDLDETGAAVESSMVWTGDHRGSGNLVQATCANWTSNDASYHGWQGVNVDAGEARSRWSTRACNETGRLYCFED